MSISRVRVFQDLPFVMIHWPQELQQIDWPGQYILRNVHGNLTAHHQALLDYRSDPSASESELLGPPTIDAHDHVEIESATKSAPIQSSLS
jgi:hypothetical protein